MPHLSFEYSTGLGDMVDLQAFCGVMRDDLVASGVFPLAGTRVRGFEADVTTVADGGNHHFLDIVLRIGAGRSDEVKSQVADRLYATAQGFLEQQVTTPFMLSLEVIEADARFSRKSWNTVRAALADG